MALASFGTGLALAGACAMALLAAWLLALNFRSRLHRSFALLLVLRALWSGSVAFTGQWDDVVGRTRVYVLIAVPFVAAYFALSYHAARRGHQGNNLRPAFWALLGAGMAAQLAYLANHDWYRTDTWYGPLQLFHGAEELVYAVIAWLFARDHAVTGRRRYLLASLGFGLEAAYYSTFYVVSLFSFHHAWDASTAFLFASEALNAVTLAVLVLAVAQLALVRESSARRAPWILALPAACALFAGLVAAMTTGGLLSNRLHLVFRSFWTLSLPALVTWSLARHHLFGARVPLRWTLRNGTVAAVFVAAFFAAGETAQAFFGARTSSPYIGIALASLLIFALTPLQRVGDRVARAAVPERQVLREGERLRIYREQLELAWMDGELTRKERLLFDRLRRQLGISPEDSTRMESEVVRGAG